MNTVKQAATIYPLLLSSNLNRIEEIKNKKITLYVVAFFASAAFLVGSSLIVMAGIGTIPSAVSYGVGGAYILLGGAFVLWNVILGRAINRIKNEITNLENTSLDSHICALTGQINKGKDRFHALLTDVSQEVFNQLFSAYHNDEIGIIFSRDEHIVRCRAEIVGDEKMLEIYNSYINATRLIPNVHVQLSELLTQLPLREQHLFFTQLYKLDQDVFAKTYDAFCTIASENITKDSPILKCPEHFYAHFFTVSKLPKDTINQFIGFMSKEYRARFLLAALNDIDNQNSDKMFVEQFKNITSVHQIQLIKSLQDQSELLIRLADLINKYYPQLIPEIYIALDQDSAIEANSLPFFMQTLHLEDIAIDSYHAQNKTYPRLLVPFHSAFFAFYNRCQIALKEEMMLKDNALNKVIECWVQQNDPDVTNQVKLLLDNSFALASQLLKNVQEDKSISDLAISICREHIKEKIAAFINDSTQNFAIYFNHPECVNFDLHDLNANVLVDIFASMDDERLSIFLNHDQQIKHLQSYLQTIVGNGCVLSDPNKSRIIKNIIANRHFQTIEFINFPRHQLASIINFINIESFDSQQYATVVEKTCEDFDFKNDDQLTALTLLTQNPKFKEFQIHSLFHNELVTLLNFAIPHFYQNSFGIAFSRVYINDFDPKNEKDNQALIVLANHPLLKSLPDNLYTRALLELKNKTKHDVNCLSNGQAHLAKKLFEDERFKQVYTADIKKILGSKEADWQNFKNIASS